MLRGYTQSDGPYEAASVTVNGDSVTFRDTADAVAHRLKGLFLGGTGRETSYAFPSRGESAAQRRDEFVTAVAAEAKKVNLAHAVIVQARPSFADASTVGELSQR